MPTYQDFTTTRTTVPDPVALLGLLRANVDPVAGFGQPTPTTYRVKKPTVWTAPQIAAAQTAIDTAPASTDQRSAQSAIDQMTVFDKAIILTILDQFNLIRSKLPTPLAAITVAQMISAIRTKAGEL